MTRITPPTGRVAQPTGRTTNRALGVAPTGSGNQTSFAAPVKPDYAGPDLSSEPGFMERMIAARSASVHRNLLSALAEDRAEKVARTAQANLRLTPAMIERLLISGAAHSEVILGRPDVQSVDEELITAAALSGTVHERLAAAANPIMYPAVLKRLSADPTAEVEWRAALTLRDVPRTQPRV